MKEKHAARGDIFRVTEFSSLLRFYSKKTLQKHKNGEYKCPWPEPTGEYLNDQKMTTTLTLT